MSYPQMSSPLLVFKKAVKPSYILNNYDVTKLFILIANNIPDSPSSILKITNS